MADDETTDATEVNDATDAATPEKKPRASVTLPAWALVAVAVLGAGGIGYAIGNDNDGSRNLIDPIADVRSAPGDHLGNGDDRGGACPRPFSGRDGGPLQGPGRRGFGPDGLPGGPLGPGFDTRGERRNPDGGQDRDDRDDEGQDQDTDDSRV